MAADLSRTLVDVVNMKGQSKEKLSAVLGISEKAAAKLLNAAPYDSSSDLLTKSKLTDAEVADVMNGAAETFCSPHEAGTSFGNPHFVDSYHRYIRALEVSTTNPAEIIALEMGRTKAILAYRRKNSGTFGTVGSVGTLGTAGGCVGTAGTLFCIGTACG